MEKGEYVVLVCYGSQRFLIGNFYTERYQAEQVAAAVYKQRIRMWSQRKNGEIKGMDRRAGAKPQVAVVQVKELARES